jgi:predicted porin
MGVVFATLPVCAAEPITLSLGGRLREFFYVADQTSAPTERLSATGTINDVRISFQGRTVLDNGITVRAFARIYAVGRFSRTLDEAYAEVNSGLGKVRIGETEGVNYRVLGDPVPEAFLTRDEELLDQALVPRTGITVRDAFTFRRFTGNAPGIAYESPEIVGLKMGVAYHPSLSPFAGGSPIDKRFAAHNGLDVSAAFSGDYPGGTYRIGMGYFHSEPGLFGIEGNKAVNVTAGVTYGGWDFSGSYIDVSPTSGRDQTAWTVGALYAFGPFRVSTNYMHATREAVRNGSRRERLDRESIQGSYKLAPGVTVGVTGFRADQTDQTGASWDGAGFLSGIKLVF